jgi:YidC/Oxa1 family membrane protein insertase
VGNALRFAFILLTGMLLFMWFGNRDQESTEGHKLQNPEVTLPEQRNAYEYCEIKTESFRAQLTSRGATLKRFELRYEKYQKGGTPHDVSTTPQPGTAPGTPQEEDPRAGADQAPGTAHEFRQQLFANFRNITAPNLGEAPNWNAAFDSVDWQLAKPDETSCEFTYSDDTVTLRKLIAATDHPYELKVTTSIENTSTEAREHAFAIDTVAWWLNSDVESEMFRVSPYVTKVGCVGEDDSAVRMLPDEFEPDELADPAFRATSPWSWYQAAAVPAFADVSNAYFSHALVPLDDSPKPVCQLQIETRNQGGGAASGAFYRARLAYPVRNLGPGEAATYDVLSYIGPKERRVLESAGGGGHRLVELIDLGFFAAIAKVLVGFLLNVYSFIPNWGVAIIILTVCARVLLFPLSIPGIRTMIKMRELKPELDALTEKYKDDMRAKGVAQMELFRKHNMSPFDQVKGCLPQLATMPVWFALYTTLQTAVELYNIPFLWFPDLSEPDPYFILPFVIGGVFFLQQKIMPFTGDPAQRKMMMYMMPGMFTVFMLFLPAGLGVYMFTNSVLAIVQQYAVEVHMRSANAKKGALEITIKEDDESSKPGKRRPKRRRT